MCDMLILVFCSKKTFTCVNILIKICFTQQRKSCNTLKLTLNISENLFDKHLMVYISNKNNVLKPFLNKLHVFVLFSRY